MKKTARTLVTFGEIMGRFATTGFRRFRQAFPGVVETTFAGAEASVAVSFSYLGGKSRFVTALPDNPLAEACIAELNSYGVETDQILCIPGSRLGLFFLEPGVNQRSANVIYDRENSAVAVTPGSEYDWDAVFDSASWFLISGITPAISKNAAELTQIAMQEATSRGIKIACDINYRSKLWNWDPACEPQKLASKTMKELLEEVTLFIGGLTDAREILGIVPSNSKTDSYLDVARQMTKKYPQMNYIAMTRREQSTETMQRLGGMLYSRKEDQTYFAPIKDGSYEPYSMTNIVDRLGAGDAFTAGLLYSLTQENNSSEEVISFATAASCLSHSIAGDYHLSTKEEVEALINQEHSGKVNR